jgi:sulfate adenylyltransferase subunit 1 (EFTu-like GTPase family)
MNWYHGKTFLNLIETIEIRKNKNPDSKRFPVQTIIRPNTAEFQDYRGYAGRVAGGVFKPGDEVTVLPSLRKTKIKSIDVPAKNFQKLLKEIQLQYPCMTRLISVGAICWFQPMNCRL